MVEPPSKNFYGEKDLNGYSYYYYLPNTLPMKKQEISQKITSNKGKVTLSLKPNSVVLIEKKDQLQKRAFKKEVLSTGNLEYLNSENQIEQIKSLSPNVKNTYHCLLLDDFLSAITKFDNDKQIFEKFVKFGMPSSVEKAALIALLCEDYGFEKKTHWHEFERVKESKIKNSESKYDIPKFIKTIPNGFSAFSTIEEKDTVSCYKSKTCNLKETKEQYLTQNIEDEPVPLREHVFCHLCHKNYKNYIDHISSKIHLQNYKLNEDCYIRLKDTFARIRKNTKIKTPKKVFVEEYSQKFVNEKHNISTVTTAQTDENRIQFSPDYKKFTKKKKNRGKYIPYTMNRDYLEEQIAKYAAQNVG